MALGEKDIGWVRRADAERLRIWSDLFAFSTEQISIRNSSEKDLTEKFAGVAKTLARDGAIQGWRGETYAVHAESGGEPLFHIERAAQLLASFYEIEVSGVRVPACARVKAPWPA